MTTEQLSQREIWDDSALVDSWNEALEEYRKYHSIAAKGERVDDAVAAVEDAETHANEDKPTHNGLPAWGPKDEELPDAHEGVADADTTTTTSPKDHAVHVSAEPTLANTTALPAGMPQAIIGAVQDDNLKNLMMSWYYAGYYTGLYEGQLKTSVSPKDSKSGKGD